MVRRRQRKLSKKEAKAQKKQQTTDNQQLATRQVVDRKLEVVSQAIEVPSVLTVREFAETLKIPVTEVIASLIKNGVMATINESIDFDTMAIICDELGFVAKLKDQ